MDAQHDNSKVVFFMGSDPGNHTFAFNEALKGYRLDNMPGYPSDTRLMPQMQLSPDQRLCFYSWPSSDWWVGITQNTDTPLVDNLKYVDNYYCDSIFGDSSSPKKIIPVGANQGYFYNIGVLPVDKIFCEDYIKRGSPVEMAGASHLGMYNLFAGGFVGSGTYQNNPNVVTGYWGKTNPVPSGGFFSPWTGLNIVSLDGRFFYRAVSNFNMLWLNVQYQVDRFLKKPYNVKELVPYGTSYPNFLKDILKYGDRGRLKLFLSNINFFNRPESNKTFWDKLLNLAPVVVATAFTIVSMGVGTPFMVATVAAAFGSAALKAWQAKNGYEKKQEQEMENPENNDTRDTVPGTSGNGGSFSKDWLYAGGIVVLALLLLKNKKR